MAQVFSPKNQLSSLTLILSGQVQGVFLREFICRFIESWNACSSKDEQVTGTIENLPDKTVQVLLEGREEVLERLLPLFYIGSPRAQIERIEEKSWEQVTDRAFQTFDRLN